MTEGRLKRIEDRLQKIEDRISPVNIAEDELSIAFISPSNHETVATISIKLPGIKREPEEKQ